MNPHRLQCAEQEVGLGHVTRWCVCWKFLSMFLPRSPLLCPADDTAWWRDLSAAPVTLLYLFLLPFHHSKYNFLSLSVFLTPLSVLLCVSSLLSLSLTPNKMKWGLSWPSSSAQFFVQVIVLRVQGEAPECLCVTWLLGTRKFTLRPRITGNDLAPKADDSVSKKIIFLSSFKVSCLRGLI